MGETIVSIRLENCFILFSSNNFSKESWFWKFYWIIIVYLSFSINLLAIFKHISSPPRCFPVKISFRPINFFNIRVRFWNLTWNKVCLQTRGSLNRKPAQLADSPLPINKSRGRLYSLEEPIVTRLYTMKESRHAYKRKHRSTVLVKTWKLCEPLNNRTYHAERSLMSAGKEQLNLGRDIAFPLHRGSRSFSRSPFPPSSSPAFRKKGESGERENCRARWSKFDYKGERARLAEARTDRSNWTFVVPIESNKVNAAHKHPRPWPEQALRSPFPCQPRVHFRGKPTRIALEFSQTEACAIFPGSLPSSFFH